jgi:hypothetical protein
MKKYNTRPIDFTGCHPVIAEALKRGEAIKCKVWDDGHPREETRYVVSYWPKTYISEGLVVWDRAEPIPRKTRRIMPPERAIPVLIAEGWKFDDNGAMYSFGKEHIHIRMFSRMGNRLDDPNTISWSWPDCIIEEVEDDE